MNLPHVPELNRVRGRRFTQWLLGTGALLMAVALALRFVPLPEALFEPPPPSVELTDRHGELLRVATDSAGQFHRRVSERELPTVLVAATLAAEDARFREHRGVDFRATARAALQWVRHRRIISGGSTLTQQLVKLAEPRRRTLRTKLCEALQARRLEQLWSKEQILAAYLNRIDYGNLNRGACAAAHHYFHKAPGDLSLAEAAFLSGLPQSPTRLNPRRNFPAAKARQEWILGRLETLGWITPNERQQASAEPLLLAPPPREFLAPHFTDFVLAQLPATTYGRLATTLDLPLQRFCESAIARQVTQWRNRGMRQGSVVVLDNRTGELLALVGSADYFDPQAGQVNGATAVRSPGSALKPFTYALAFQRGYAPGTILADVPTEYPTPTGLFRPQNYGRRCYGPIRCRQALANSLNLPAVRVLDALGGAAPLHAELQRLGLTTLTQPPEWYGLGLTLGNAGVTLLELANAYAALARMGEARPVTWKLSADAPARRPESTNAPTPSQRAACWLVADILADPEARELEFGLRSPLRFDFAAACKTGTSSDYRDNWAFGFTPEFTVGVWVGNFEGVPMREISGVTGAAPVMHEVLEHLHRQHGTTWYERPPELTAYAIHPLTGHQLLDGSSDRGVVDWFPPGLTPELESTADYGPDGRVALGPEYRDWLATGGRARSRDFSLAVPAAAAPLRVLSPLEGTAFWLDADLPSASQRVPLRASREVEWTSPTLRCVRQGDATFAELQEGRHRLVARDPVTGLQAGAWIEVRRL